eukprot:COSAG01_NODE_5915_length_3956_cov_6.655432_3_plen_68_part_00
MKLAVAPVYCGAMHSVGSLSQLLWVVGDTYIYLYWSTIVNKTNALTVDGLLTTQGRGCIPAVSDPRD